MDLRKTILAVGIAYAIGALTPTIVQTINERSPLERKISVSKEITGQKPYPTSNWKLHIYKNKIDLMEPGFITRQPYMSSKHILDTNRDGELDTWQQNITTRILSEQEKNYWQPKYEELLEKYDIGTSRP